MHLFLLFLAMEGVGFSTQWGALFQQPFLTWMQVYQSHSTESVSAQENMYMFSNTLVKWHKLKLGNTKPVPMGWEKAKL